MGEQEPGYTSVILSFRNEDMPRILGILAGQSQEVTRVGQLDMGLAQQIDRIELSRRVSLLAVRRFYDEVFQDDTPSPIATTAFREIGSIIPDDFKDIDKEGHAIVIERSAWDVAVGGILAVKQEGLITWGPGSKKKRFISDFQAFLPPSEDAEVKKKKPRKKS